MVDCEDLSVEVQMTDASNVGVELNTVNGDHSRQLESRTTRIYVLLGSGILQLPIWGTY